MPLGIFVSKLKITFHLITALMNMTSNPTPSTSETIDARLATKEQLVCRQQRLVSQLMSFIIQSPDIDEETTTALK